MREKLISRGIVVLVIAIFITIGLSSCSNQLTGTYISEKNDKHYIELKADGIFFVQESTGTRHGNYEIEGNVITLKFKDGVAARGKIEGKVLIDPDGDKWIRK